MEYVINFTWDNEANVLTKMNNMESEVINNE